jgi:hypothetical protein
MLRLRRVTILCYNCTVAICSHLFSKKQSALIPHYSQLLLKTAGQARLAVWHHDAPWQSTAKLRSSPPSPVPHAANFCPGPSFAVQPFLCGFLTVK